MTTSYVLPTPPNVTGEVYSVAYTRLADGRMLLTYIEETGGAADQAFFQILNPDLSSAGFLPVAIGTDVVPGSRLVATETADGGFAVVWDIAGSFGKFSRFASDGSTIIDGTTVASNDDEVVIKSSDDGTVSVFSSFVLVEEEYHYTYQFPIFGSRSFNWTLIEDQSSETATLLDGFRLPGVFGYSVASIFNSNTGQTRLQVERLSSAGTTWELEPAGFNFSMDAQARVLTNGNVMFVITTGNGNPRIEIRSSDLNTVVSTVTLTGAADIGHLDLMDRDDGTYTLIALSETSGTNVFFQDISATGAPIGTMTPVAVPQPAGAFMFYSPDADARWVDVVPLDNDGWGVVISDTTATNGTEYVLVEGVGTEFLDIQEMRAEGYFNGGASADFVKGSSGNDTIIGGSGSDALWGEGGNDIIYLDIQPSAVFSLFDPSTDTAWGGAGDDLIVNITGDSRIYGEDGNDNIRSGSGNDQVWGGDDNDIIRLDGGNDYGDGGNGSDRIFGRAGDDELLGRAGADIIYGGSGNDIVLGGSSKDVLRGGAGDDRLDGGTGADTLMGGAGDDILTGGTKADVFVFGGDGTPYSGNEPEVDIITDFVSGEDILQIKNATGVSSFADITLVGFVPDAYVIEYGNREILVTGSIAESDFQFI